MATRTITVGVGDADDINVAGALDGNLVGATGGTVEDAIQEMDDLTFGGIRSFASPDSGEYKLLMNIGWLSQTTTSAWLTAGSSEGKFDITGFTVDEAYSIDLIGMELLTPPDGASSVMRLGIYASDSHGRPTGAPLVDVATTPATMTSGTKELVISPSVELPVGRYVAGLVFQDIDTGGALPIYRAFDDPGSCVIGPFGSFSPTFSSYATAQKIVVDGVSGALPTDPTLTFGSWYPRRPRMWVRAV